MCVQPTDLCQPNPVQVLMLCAHLYEALPQFLPKDTISLSGNLHGTLSKQAGETASVLNHLQSFSVDFFTVFISSVFL